MIKHSISEYANLEANQNGQSYKHRISTSRSPDVYGWSGNVLHPKVRAVFREYSEKYGWGDPGKADYGTEDQDVAQKVARAGASIDGVLCGVLILAVLESLDKWPCPAL